MQRLFAATFAYNNGAPNSKLPALGWSSWVALGPGAEHPIFDYCEESGVMAAVDAFHAVGLYEAGYRHFHLDDCWAGGRNATGYLYPELDHFPNGMKPVVDYAHSKGLTFGLYTCAGTLTCVGGRPGSKDHWTQDANVFAEWGVDWVKMDWCNTDGMHPREAYGNMSAALNATGRHMHLNMCEWGLENPWEWGANIAQSWRMGSDHTGKWASTKDVVRHSAAIPASFTGRPWAWNDMDMLETGNYEQAAFANNKQPNMTAIEYHTEFTMWAISASPLTVTTPIMNCTVEDGSKFGSTTSSAKNGTVRCLGWISELQKAILLNTEVLAINQDVTPQGRPVVEGDLRVWARRLTGGAVAVALYNEEEDPMELSVDLTTLGLPEGAPAAVRDLWARLDLGTYSGRYPETGKTVTVAPHEAKLLRVTPQ